MQSAYLWAQRVGYLSEKFAVSRISRSLASFSHAIQLTDSKSGEQLFRAMQGLESFYCDGTGDLRKQLQDKTEVWLSEWQSKFSCGKLYGIRSKFVHGSSLIDYSNSIDFTENELKNESEINYASNLALRLLASTLQRCIADDVQDIIWKVSYETKS